MAPIQPPPWHKIYPKGTPVPWLTDIITAHARSALAATHGGDDKLQDATQDSMNVDDDDDDDEDGTSIAIPDGDAVPSLLPHVDKTQIP